MGGIYISHMRDEASGVLDSVRETIEIGEKGGLPTQVTHHKVIGKANWGKSVETLKLVDEARARGVDATIDQYPYTASRTSIQAALMPAWALEGGRQAVLKRLQTASMRSELRKETARIILDERGGGDPQNVQLARCDWDHSLDGKRLGDVTKGRGLEPTIENAAETALWIVEKGGCQGIFHAISEEDLQRILRHPATMIGSDGEVPIFGVASPHPRSYGTFVRVLGRYVRELKVDHARGRGPQDVVVSRASASASPIAGCLREGMKADIAVFDPATVRDTATFERPHQYAEGVLCVVVNGQVAFENGTMTPARPGQILLGCHRPAASAVTNGDNRRRQSASFPRIQPYTLGGETHAKAGGCGRVDGASRGGPLRPAGRQIGRRADSSTRAEDGDRDPSTRPGQAPRRRRPVPRFRPPPSLPPARRQRFPSTRRTSWWRRTARPATATRRRPAGSSLAGFDAATIDAAPRRRREDDPQAARRHDAAARRAKRPDAATHRRRSSTRSKRRSTPRPRSTRIPAGARSSG